MPPLHRFDIVGFSLQYELTYTNVLNMLDLAGIPMRSADRAHGPLIIGGAVSAPSIPNLWLRSLIFLWLVTAKKFCRNCWMFIKTAGTGGADQGRDAD